MAKQQLNEPLNPQHVAVVLTADLAQIEADSKTHPDSDARERIAKAVGRIYSIVEGTLTSEIRAKVLSAAELMNSASSSKIHPTADQPRIERGELGVG